MNHGGWVGRWAGRTVVCIASGPSLTTEDCETVRASGHPTIVTNTTFKLCPWADALFGFDGAWWEHYRREIDLVFKGARLTCHQKGRTAGGAELIRQEPWFTNFHNSGANAISLAMTTGAAKIVMLGYDCQKTGEKIHWHGDHPTGLGNCKSMPKWKGFFKDVARRAAQRKIEVVNCSRETALRCFPRKDLAESL